MSAVQINVARIIEEMKRHLGQMQYGHGWTLPPENHNPVGGRVGESRREIHVPFAQMPVVYDGWKNPSAMRRLSSVRK